MTYFKISLRLSVMLSLILMQAPAFTQNLEAKTKTLQELVDQQERQVRIVIFAALVPVALLFIFTFFFFYRRKRESDMRERQLELTIAKAEMEMKALRAQVNPHFIFNCLSSIQHYIHQRNNELAERYLLKFSRLIRQVLEASSNSFISIEEDLNMLELYIDLEQLRMEHSFEYELHIDESINIQDLYIPPLLLQPIVENSIWHGLSNRQGSGGKLEITFTKSPEYLTCEVIDNGQKEIITTHDSKSFGLNLIKERIHLHGIQNGKHSLELEELKDLNGTYTGMKVKLLIPYESE